MKQKLKLILKRFLPVLLVGLLLGIGIYNLNAKLLLGDPMPMPLGIGSSVVLTGSMEPAISPGDLIIVKKSCDVREQDVIVYEDGNALVVHRIIGVNGDQLITQGDANNTADDPIAREAVRGKVILAIPYVGLVVDALKSPWITLLLLGLAIWLMESSFRREKADEQDELDAIKQEIEELSEKLKK